MADTCDIQWPLSDAALSLGPSDVHVWAASLSAEPELAAVYETSLSLDELARASRFLFQRDRNRFIVGRGILRSLLGHYLAKQPAQIRIAYSERGKPRLADSPARSQIHFNLAHSDDLAVFAISRIPGIGIDVERLRPMNEAEAIAERFFSAREAKTLKTIPSTQKEIAFFNLWTRKEAWLKATGEGICEMLNQVEVSLKPGDPARLLSIFEDSSAAAEWRMCELVPAPGYVGALAVPAKDFTMHCWQWENERVFRKTPLPQIFASSRTFHEHHV